MASKNVKKDILYYFKQIKKQGGETKVLVVSPPKVGQSLEEVEAELKGIDFGSCSEFTINPKPDFIRCLSDVAIRDKIEKVIRRSLMVALRYTAKKNDTDIDRIKWNPDILLVGEHGKEGWCKLHYHGVISGIPNDVQSHFNKLVQKNIGRSEIRYIKYNESYKKYIFKSYHEEYPETWGYHSYIRINNI